MFTSNKLIAAELGYYGNSILLIFEFIIYIFSKKLYKSIKKAPWPFICILSILEFSITKLLVSAIINDCDIIRLWYLVFYIIIFSAYNK